MSGKTPNEAEQNKPLPSGSDVTSRLPPIGAAVWVHCRGYRTMAYRDNGRVWRCVGNGRELKGITKVEWPEWRW